MIEIRPMRAGEDGAFVDLLSEVFSLDSERALPLFTSDPMYDRERNWGLFVGGRMVSCLTTRPLEFGWGRAVGIAGVCTLEAARGEGYAARLIERVLRESERADEGPALLFCVDDRLYGQLGFEPLDRVVTARVKSSGERPPLEEPSLEAVRARYDAWAQRSPERLRRDERRWSYWAWKYRTVLAHDNGGYASLENDVVREVLAPNAETGLPVPEGTEAFALTYVIDKLDLPFEPLSVEMYLMGRGIPGLVQMFLTDQF